MDSRFLFLPTAVFFLIALFLWWNSRPEDFATVMTVAGFGNLFAAWWIMKSRRDWLSFALLPALLLWSSLSYALLVSSQQLAWLILLLSAAALIAYWRLVYMYAFKHANYRPFSLERLSGYISFMTAFFSAAAAYGLKTFLDLPTWQLILGIVGVQAGLAYQWMWVQKAEWKHTGTYALLFIAVAVEFFIIFGFLPFDFNILGFFLASIWYGVSYIASAQASGQLTKSKWRFALGLVAASWLLVLLTARWF